MLINPVILENIGKHLCFPAIDLREVDNLIDVAGIDMSEYIPPLALSPRVSLYVSLCCL